MSIDSITGDEFAHLDAETHSVAFSMYEAAVDQAMSELAGGTLYGPQRSQLLDRLSGLLQLRKLHKQRLAELEEDAAAAAVPASERYHRNQLASVS